MAIRRPDADPDAFRKILTDWFRTEGRDYPWRRTQDPYEILVSEVMLQQTQIKTVLDGGYFARWLKAFPTFQALAEASEEAVLKAWEGLGYYRRARHLHQLARMVVEVYGGRLPQSDEAIRALPGIGRYTAGALLSFAFNQPAPLVDGNVARVLARLFDLRKAVDSPAGQKTLWSWAETLVSPRDARIYNAALMELGQRICTKVQPQCGVCPVSAFCQTRQPDVLPLKMPLPKTVFLDEHTLFAIDAERLLLARESGGRRKGLWKLPERPPETLQKGWHLVYRAKYSITHHRVTLHIYAPANSGSVRITLQREESWHPLKALDELAMAAPYRKAIVRLIDGPELFRCKP